MQKLRSGIRHVLYGIWFVVGVVVIGIFLAIDYTRFYIDRVFHTKLMAMKVTDEEVEQLIEANLPIGSSIEEIFAFLNTRKIEHSERLIDRDAFARYGGFPYPNPRLEAKKDVIKTALTASIPNVGRHLMVKWDVIIYFYLDDQNKFVEYLVYTRGTGF